MTTEQPQSAATNSLISKKELLELTGISYGQLYRWKRERLLPEEWFIKRSAFTGQETYFPREQVLERVKTILDLKDSYSLEQIARMLSPQSGDSYALPLVDELIEVPPTYLAAFKRALGATDEPTTLYLPQMALVECLGQVKAAEASVDGRAQLAATNLELAMQWSGETMHVLLLAILHSPFVTPGDDNLFLAMYKGTEPPLFSAGIRTVATLEMAPAAKRIKQQILNQEAGR
jgi:DNA-binding transcriptional MerR regulator